MEAHYNTTANKILHTAARLFMQRGYRAVSINDIVQAAEITKPTLYYHFADKEELFVQMGEQMLKELHDRINQALATSVDFYDRCVALTETLLTGTEGDVRTMRREMREHLSPTAQNRLWEAYRDHLFGPVLGLMQEGAAAGHVQRYSPMELTGLFLGMVSAFMRTEEASSDLARSMPIDMVSAKALVDLFLYGAASPAPAKS